ncbi:glycosyltransferase [Bacteroidota bacterium]
MLVSVVVPFFNEEALVNEFIDRINAAVKSIEQPVEVVAVDDGSSDNTLPLLLVCREKNPTIRIVSLSRNFGLQAAIQAGIEHARGDYVIVMDGDLQDPPELIPELIDNITGNDTDILVGRRISRKEKWPKRLLIRWFHKIIEPGYSKAKQYDTGNFCILKRIVAVAILNAGEKQRYFPGIRSYVGFKVDYYDYERQGRATGNPKMTTRKLISLAGDALFIFSKWPIRVCFYIGLTGLVAFLLAIIYTLLSKILGLAPLGWSSTFISIYFFGSLQLFFLGVIGEYVFRIYKEVQNRPLYVVREIYDREVDPE